MWLSWQIGVVAVICVVCAARHSVCESQPSRGMEPWRFKDLPTDEAKHHVEEIDSARHVYTVIHGGTVDGRSCRSPAGAYGGFMQTWESNRAVRLENVGQTDVVNPWLSNGSNNFRSLKEIANSAIKPGMTDREKALALYYQEIAHRYHWHSGDNPEHCDPVKVYNVYGFNTCGNDSICMAGLWQQVGLKVSPARVIGHCVSQVFYDDAWHLLDADMQGIYLLRDNHTVASEHDVVRDHDLIKRAHTQGILTPDNRSGDEWEAALYVWEGEPQGTRDCGYRHTMDMVLRPGEALVWRWGHLEPIKSHGENQPEYPDTVCNGLWEYRPDFSSDIWRRGTEKMEGIKQTSDGFDTQATQPKGLVAESSMGTIIWKMYCPYVFIGGKLEVEGSGAKFSVSIDGKSWQNVSQNFDQAFPANGEAQYEYYLRCQLSGKARLKRLAIINDVQMAALALPEMVIGENTFVYTDESPHERQVRITHKWMERSVWNPPQMPERPTYPQDEGETEGTDIVFKWIAATDPDGATIADYHFELSEREDINMINSTFDQIFLKFEWPLSTNFAKLISLTADKSKSQYTLPYTGLLTPDHTYYWRVRPKNSKGMWGPWSKTWRFTVRGPAHPIDVRMDYDPNQGIGTLRWKTNPVGRRPVKYRIYGSDEKGFSVSDKPYQINLGNQKEGKMRSPFRANFVAETTNTEMVVVGVGLTLPNTNKAYYRVVAVDQQGNRSGPSDYAEAPRPFIYSTPVEEAQVGQEYCYQVACISSLGDLRARGELAMNFWDIEEPQFMLAQGPEWLKIDARMGILSGQPDAVGKHKVVVTATIDKEVRELDTTALSWGKEKVISKTRESAGSASQEFVINVTR